jgi:hypothetical protein
MTTYDHQVIPTAWCSECGKGGCEHTDRMTRSLIESFEETKLAHMRKLKGLTGEPYND